MQCWNHIIFIFHDFTLCFWYISLHRREGSRGWAWRGYWCWNRSKYENRQICCISVECMRVKNKVTGSSPGWWTYITYHYNIYLGLDIDTIQVILFRIFGKCVVILVVIWEKDWFFSGYLGYLCDVWFSWWWYGRKIDMLWTMWTMLPSSLC